MPKACASMHVQCPGGMLCLCYMDQVAACQLRWVMYFPSCWPDSAGLVAGVSEAVHAGCLKQLRAKVSSRIRLAGVTHACVVGKLLVSYACCGIFCMHGLENLRFQKSMESHGNVFRYLDHAANSNLCAASSWHAVTHSHKRT